MSKKTRDYPFDVQTFIKDNTDLVKKYLKKNTYKIDVPDFDPVADDLYQGNPLILKRTATFEYSGFFSISSILVPIFTTFSADLFRFLSIEP